MIPAVLLAVGWALAAEDGTPSLFSEIRIDPAFAPYLQANPLLMEVTGAKIIRLPERRGYVLLAVASAVLKDQTPRSRLQAERVCQTKALAYLVREERGVQVSHVEEGTERTKIVIEEGRERGTSVSEFLSRTRTEVEGIARDLPVVGRWKSADGEVFFVAIGAFLDAEKNPLPQSL